MLASPPLNGRRASSCLAVAGRLGARSPLTVPAPAALHPGSAASRSNFLPTSRSAPREPAPESSLLGRSRPRASARRPSRRSMCGRACTPRTRAAARARTGAGSRLAAWPARPFKFLSHSAAAKRAQSADWHVARGRSASPRRRSWPPARAQRPRHSRSASRRRSASERANSHCAEIHTRTEIETGNDVRPRTADYENETYAVRRNRSPKTWGQFCCVPLGARGSRTHPDQRRPRGQVFRLLSLLMTTHGPLPLELRCLNSKMHWPSAELGRGPPHAAWRGSVGHPSGGPSAPGRRCWRLGRKRPSPFSNSGPTPLRSDPNLEGLKSLRCCCAKGVGHRAQLMLRARRGARENDYPVPLLRTPTPQSSLSPVLTHSRGVTTTESLELPTEMIWCGSPLSSQPSRWK